MAYKIVATVTGRKSKYEYTREFSSERQPTREELRFLRKRLSQSASGYKHFRGRPEDFDVWIEVSEIQDAGNLMELQDIIAIDPGKLIGSFFRELEGVSA